MLKGNKLKPRLRADNFFLSEEKVVFTRAKIIGVLHNGQQNAFVSRIST